MGLSLRWVLSLLLVLSACGLPSETRVPAAPIASDTDSESDNQLAFVTPNDPEVDRYVIWYKIYPNLNRTKTESLINSDRDHFKDQSLRKAADIRQRNFQELYYNSDPESNYYLFGLGVSVEVSLRRNPANTTNYIQLTTGSTNYTAHRNVPLSATDNQRKPFYGKYNRNADSDLRPRSRFDDYTSSLDRGFAVAFLAQSAYVDSLDLSIVTSQVTHLGAMYSNAGFEDN